MSNYRRIRPITSVKRDLEKIPFSDWTLKEVQDYCTNAADGDNCCDDCKIMENGIYIGCATDCPKDWLLDDFCIEEPKLLSLFELFPNINSITRIDLDTVEFYADGQTVKLKVAPEYIGFMNIGDTYVPKKDYGRR